MEPPVAVPIAPSHREAATAAADPLEDPPAIRAGSTGFLTGPECGLTLVLRTPTRGDSLADDEATRIARRLDDPCVVLVGSPGQDLAAAHRDVAAHGDEVLYRARGPDLRLIRQGDERVQMSGPLDAFAEAVHTPLHLWHPRGYSTLQTGGRVRASAWGTS